jgi:hypothetical protein
MVIAQMTFNKLVLLLWLHSIALLWIAKNNCSIMKDISNDHYQCNYEVIGIDFVVTTVAVFVVGLYNMLD